MKKFAITRKFGIEIEVGYEISKFKIKDFVKENSIKKANFDLYRPSCNNDFWHIKDDATCGINGRKGYFGVEIASYVARTYDDLLEISNIADKLSSFGCKVNDNCGLHIHADCSDLTKDQIAIISAIWLKIEKCLQFSLPENRRNNQYCKMFDAWIKDKIDRDIDYSKKVEEFYELCRPVDIGFFENKDRRVNLNLVNYARACVYKSNSKKTLELRWPEGTLDKDDVKNWGVLFLNFIEICKNKKFPKSLKDADIFDVLKLLGLGRKNLNKSLKEVKVWLLKRFLKYSNFCRKEIENILNTL